MTRIVGSLLIATLVWGLGPTKKVTFDYYISKVTWNQKVLVAGLENGKVVIEPWKWIGEELKIKSEGIKQEEETNPKKRDKKRDKKKRDKRKKEKAKETEKPKVGKPLAVIQLPKVHDFMGKLKPMSIYSLDLSPDGQKLLILGEGENAHRVVFIYTFQTRELEKVWETPLALMRGVFTTNGRILFALLSDEALLFDLDRREVVYRKQIGNYVFSNWAVTQNRKRVVFGDESGSTKLVNVETGEIEEVISGWNKDKTVGVDINKRYIINGSSDQRISVYDYLQRRFKEQFKSQFLPYGVAISSDGRLIAYQLDEKNRIEVRPLEKGNRQILEGHTMALNGIKFEKNTTLISYSPAEVLIWKLTPSQ